MNTKLISEPEVTPLQERMSEVVEDRSRPAEQILKEQSEEENRPAVFVP